MIREKNISMILSSSKGEINKRFPIFGSMKTYTKHPQENSGGALYRGEIQRIIMLLEIEFVEFQQWVQLRVSPR